MKIAKAIATKRKRAKDIAAARRKKANQMKLDATEAKRRQKLRTDKRRKFTIKTFFPINKLLL